MLNKMCRFELTAVDIKALLHLMKLTSATVDAAFFDRIYGTENSRKWRFGTFNQKYKDIFKQVKISLIRRGVILFAEEHETWEKNTKLERLRFRFPEEFHSFLPLPFGPARSISGPVIYKNREKFEKTFKEHCRKHGLSVPATIQKAVLKALSEQDETADICLDKKGNPEPDTSLRDNENVPLKEDIREYFEQEVLPHVPDAWIDESKTVKGYEINITKSFYKYKPLRPLADVRADILALEQETEGMNQEVLEG